MRSEEQLTDIQRRIDLGQTPPRGLFLRAARDLDVVEEVREGLNTSAEPQAILDVLSSAQENLQ